MSHTRALIASIAVASLALAACGGDDDSVADPEASGDTSEPSDESPDDTPDDTSDAEPADEAGSGTDVDGSSGGETGDEAPDATDTLLIGSSLPLTGPLGAFGPLLQSGYESAISEVNDAGGLSVGDTTYTVELTVVDNKSDGNEAAAQARDLMLGDEVVALLGAVTPPLTIPLSVAAEQNRVPLVSTVTPVQAWLGGNPDGWNYAFDFFFDEPQMTDLQFQASDLVDTNKKVALFTDLEEDGIVMGGLWEEKAAEFGYEIVYRAEFPVGTTNFASQVDEAAAADAEVVIAQVVPPDAIALLKQMKASGYTPKTMFIEKGSSFGAWPQASEGLGDGVMVAGWFAEGLGTPDEQKMLDLFVPGDAPFTSDAQANVAAYTAAKVLLDGIAAAGSTEPDAIVAALENLSGDYPLGPIDFADDHSAPIPAIMTQWNDGELIYVTAPDGGAGAGEVVSPVTGLAR